MTASQLEHLKLIDAHLERLLAIADKRTPGEWVYTALEKSDSLRLFSATHYLGSVGNSDDEPAQNHQNATFISQCAGNAEAGWRATRAAIDTILSIERWVLPKSNAGDMAESILAAFPIESLK